MPKAVTHRNKNQHVIPLGAGWAVKQEDASKFFVITTKQSEAIGVARKLAQSQGSELVIHSRDGHIRERQSYAKAVAQHAPKKK